MATVCRQLGPPSRFYEIGHRDIWTYVNRGRTIVRISFDSGYVIEYGGLGGVG